MGVNGTLVEDKMRRFKGECEHFRFNKCPIYTHDGASAKFSTISQEMDNSALLLNSIIHFQGRTVDMKTLTLIEEPTEQNLEEAEAEFERLLEENP